jgi:formylglycine-generating enzyme required for sulfatase activity
MSSVGWVTTSLEPCTSGLTVSAALLRPSGRLGFLTGLLASLWACDPGAQSPATVPPASRAEAATAPVEAPPAAADSVKVAASSTQGTAVTPHQEIAVPAGSLWLGSRTGSVGRNASREADHVRVEVPAFAIDALPYPNDPASKARAMVSRDEAQSLCAAQGKRLCSEFEWERACKGDASADFPAAAFDAAACAADAARCASPLGVFGLGTQGREWTGSRAGKGLGDAMRTVVVKGATKDAPRDAHRCAARDAATPDSKSDSLLFRCCRGPQHALTYPEESTCEAFAQPSWDTAQLRALLKDMPETTGVAATLQPFAQEQVTQRLAAAGKSAASVAPWITAQNGLLWSPMHGEQVGVVAGDTPDGALLVAFHRDASGAPTFGASYLTRNEHQPILIAYKPDVPREVLFSTCWGCGGEGGALELGPDARVRIVPR